MIVHCFLVRRRLVFGVAGPAIDFAGMHRTNDLASGVENFQFVFFQEPHGVVRLGIEASAIVKTTANHDGFAPRRDSIWLTVLAFEPLGKGISDIRQSLRVRHPWSNRNGQDCS